MIKRKYLQNNKNISSVFNGRKLFYSNFCLTDNLNFSEFYTYKKPLNYEVVKFKFDEDNLCFELDKKLKLQIKKDEILLDNFIIEKLYLNHFLDKYKKKDIEFYTLKNFCGEEVVDQNLVGLVINGKLIGIIQPHEKKDAEDENQKGIER